MFALAFCLRSKFRAPNLPNLRYSQILKYSGMTDFEQHSEVLQKLLGCSPEESVEIVKQNEALQRLSWTTLEKTIQVLQKAGIKNEEIVEEPSVMAISPATVDHHAMLLEEGGFKRVTPFLLLKYLAVVKKRVSLLKAYKLIPCDVKVLDSFLSHVEPAPSNAPPVPVSPDKQDSLLFLEVYEAVLRHYLIWRLEMNESDFARVMKIYGRFLHKSLRLYRRNLEILEGELGFTKERIRKHAYVLYSHPDNTLDSLKRIKSLAGLDVRDMMWRYPKIMMMRTDTLIQSHDYVKEFGISDRAIRQCPLILTLGSETVRKRLENIGKVPEFQALSWHPRILKLVYHQHKAISRLDYLHQQRVRCVSLNLLSSTAAAFRRFTHIGEDRNRGRDVVLYLENVLGLSTSEIRAALRRHVHWKCISLLSLRNTLEMLLARGYSKDVIYRNIQLLIYPREVVERELGLLSQREETLSAQEMCRVPVLTPDMKLSLCIYYIEKVYHFTGDGVWSSAYNEIESSAFNIPPLPYYERHQSSSNMRRSARI